MSRWFSIRPPLSFRGREFKGLRGWAGKPLHPPLTDFPVVGYVLAMTFDAVSWGAGRQGAGVARDAYLAATWVLVAGAVVSLPTLLTGFWDWLRSTPEHTQAWRTANTHMAVMLAVTLVVVVNLAVRLPAYDAASAPGLVTVLSLVAGGLVSFGALYGGSLVYEHGFNVENATKTAAWRPSDTDAYPGDRA